jgi:bla regulator protein BlaR1
VIEGLLGFALGNVLVSSALAILAYLVQRIGRYPALAHLLWVVVLVAVVTPPLLVLRAPLMLTSADGASMAGDVVVGAAATVPPLVDSPSLVERGAASIAIVGPTLLVASWLMGSAIALAVSAVRMRRFDRLLTATWSRAPRPVEQLAASVGHELGLRSVPAVFVSRARIAPMTWWSRGRVRLVLPVSLLQRADAAELRWVLAHELAHVRRRDHLVRWLEWVASVAWWWHPVVWFARRNLRLAEEDACDAMVLEHIDGSARAYASALLDTVEVLSQPRGHTPAMATGIDAARSLEHRLRAILTPEARRTAPRPLAGILVLVAVTATVIGIGPATAPGFEGLPEAAPLPVTAAADAADVGSDGRRYAPVSATLAGAGATGFIGTNGDDEYRGTGDDETIEGRAGADRLSGGGGADLIRGGAGADVIRGGSGSDELHGGAGADVIRSGAGHDVIEAGAGSDTVYSWSDGQPDRVDCGDGTDRAVVDSTDSTLRCEEVIVRDPA